MNEKIVIAADSYDHIDGRNAYHSAIKQLILGAPTMKEHKNMLIAAQIWKQREDRALEISCELPIH